MGPIVAAMMAVGMLAAPAFAAPALFCSYVVSGGSTSLISLPADCGGGTILGAGYHTIYMDLLVRCDSVSNQTEHLRVRFNGDSGASYDYGYDAGSSGTSALTANQSYGYIADVPCLAAGNLSHAATGVSLKIPGAYSTVFDKQAISVVSGENSGSSTITEHWTTSWHRTTVGAVNRIDFTFDGGADFVPGSVLDLYIE